MLGFFPTPYPDEILCSVFARYHIRSGNIKPEETLLELFNSRHITVRTDLPYNLASLIENLPLLSPYTVEGLIQKHTLYPIYAVFMPDRNSAILRYMKGELGTYIYRGTASSVHMPRYFKFCPLCLFEDLHTFGEAYWHRLHQTPGVLVCLIHNVALSDSIAPTWGNNWHRVGVASLENCPMAHSQENYSESTLEKLLLLASDIEWLMTRDLKLLPSKELDWFHIQYIANLTRRGLATSSRRVDETGLRQKLLSFYGSEFLEVLGIDVSYDNRFLFDIFQLHIEAFDPVMHLLMIRFLTNSLAKFFAGKSKYKPFGNGPWLCLNPACEHYLKPVVTKLVMHSKSDTKPLYSYIENPIGTFECNCGFKYSKSGADTTEVDKFRFERIVAFGQLWEQKYLECSDADRRNFQSTAYRLSVNYGKSPTNMLRKLEALWKSLNSSI
ncbi:TnsD family Tn7-like transposition protein [Iningainema tapete]|uniref:TniQ family protein n=1 Tax=Iningainema tapete BLCC-T55 TaxID=2748662 RepID=A0A8J7BVW9_9CYAN|nr:TnsD family Tn7-like transposition protein [Iningainema tapete]MBD2770702.1 TniQ family protein [Iningainema tapete BLCC-T55]